MQKSELSNHRSRILAYIFIYIFIQSISAQTTGKIVLENTTPATSVIATATQQIVLKSGFHATADATSSFNAKIGTSNNLSPVIQIASGSTITIPTTPTSTQNYVWTKTYLTATTDESSTTVLNSIQYLDGLGRPIQTIAAGITPNGADLVTNVGFDGGGRQNISYLPVAVGGNFGLFTDNSSISNATGTLYGSSNRPYTETLLEASPLDRVLGQKKPGADWDTHPSNVSYNANRSDILYFTVSGKNLKRESANYSANTLYKTVTTDEDGKQSVEYKDKLGHVVVKQSSTDVYTYYVYNDLKQLTYVLPPAFIDGVGSTSSFDDTNALLKQFAYVYRYDERGNCIYKKLPGCTPIYMVYDQADRMVLSQDGNQRKKLSNGSAQWTATKYDALGRVTATGLLYRSEKDSTANYKSIRDVYANLIVNDTYTGFNTATALTANYYDNYNFISSTGYYGLQYVRSTEGFDKAYPETETATSKLNATGLLTGTRVYYLDGSGNSNMTAMYYDDKGRVVETLATNHLGGYEQVNYQYNFIGKVIRSKKLLAISGFSGITEQYAYTYDNGQRLKTIIYSLNGGTAVTLASNEYDELGRLKTKTRHNGKEVGAYEYNIQNSPTKIKQGSYEENLYYNSSLPQGATANYNGNITASTWTYNSKQGIYSYQYDALNRLTATDSHYDINRVIEGWGGCNELYTYDKMGNITNLVREGLNGDDIDNLNYTYTGNQITSISDDAGSQSQYNIKEYQDKAHTPNEMTYDVNGNMVKDLDRDIVTIQYNVLNLPSIIQFKNGNQIKNLYDASGHKLGTEYYTQLTNITPLTDGQIVNQSYIAGAVDQNGTAYIGNFEYNTLKGNSTLTALSRIYNDEGYVENLTNPQYYYFRHDHLGDNREVWLANTNTTVQRTQYYPSGLPWAYQTGDNPDLQHRKYNGKEFVEMHGWDTYDYGARGNYAAIGKWTSVDPFSETTPWQSPFMFCSGNSVNRIDPTGLKDVELPEGAVVITAKAPDNNSNYSSRFLQLLNHANINTQKIPNITPPAPSISITTNINNAGTNNKDHKKQINIIQNISDALTGAGIANDGFSIAVEQEAGNEIVYVTIKGSQAAVQSAKVLRVLKGISGATIVVGIALDIVHAIYDPKYTGKAFVNTGVAIVAGVIGGFPGLVIGTTYYIVDNTIGWDRVLKAGGTEEFRLWHQGHGSGTY